MSAGEFTDLERQLVDSLRRVAATVVDDPPPLANLLDRASVAPPADRRRPGRGRRLLPATVAVAAVVVAGVLVAVGVRQTGNEGAAVRVQAGGQPRGGSSSTTVRGDGLVAVPDVVGTSPVDATDRLVAAGFRTNVVMVTDPAHAGVVAAQEPRAGARVPSGQEVLLTVGDPG